MSVFRARTIIILLVALISAIGFLFGLAKSIHAVALDTGWKYTTTTAAVNPAGDNTGFEGTYGTAPTDTTTDNDGGLTDTNSGSGYATDGCGTFPQSEDDQHDFYNFGFPTIPSAATISGIEVISRALVDSATGPNILCFGLSYNGGSNWSTASGTGALTTSETLSYNGGSAYTWGRSWSASEFTDANFRLRVMPDSAASANRDYSLDQLGVRVYYDLPPFNGTTSLSAFRFFENSTTTDIGPALTAAQNQNITLNSAGQAFRLRMLIHFASSTYYAGHGDFKLRYAVKTGGTCSGLTYADVTAVTPVAFKNNPPADGDSLTASTTVDPYHNADTVNNFSYEEANNFTNTVDIDPGEDGKWDFALFDNNAPASTTYCIIATLASGSPLTAYDYYPEITIPPAWTAIAQRAGVFQNDTGTTTIASPYTAKIGERMRVRFTLDTNTGSHQPMVFKLQYDKDSDGNWQDVTSAKEIRPAQSTIIRAGPGITGSPGATSTCYAGTTAQAGWIYNNTGRTDAFSVNGLTCQDLGFTIDTKNAVTGTTYRFRLVNLTATSTATFSYNQYPSLTTVSSDNDTTLYSKSNTIATSTATSSLAYLLDNTGYESVNSDNTIREILQNISSKSGSLGGESVSDLLLTGAANSDSFGWSVASAGDVNGDGYSDAIIGAKGYSGGGNLGRAYIVFGGLGLATNTTASSANIILTGANAGEFFGMNVASAGDVNGDGYSDVIVGASGYLSSKGRAYLFYGGPNMVSEFASTSDIIFTGINSLDYFGYSVASAGDVNADSYSDIIVGSWGYPGTSLGRAYIFYGSATMTSKVASLADVVYQGVTVSDQFGTDVASAGDVNGDGYDDVIVGANGVSTYTGRAYIFYGGGMTSETASTSDVILIGEGAGNNFGTNLSSAGDINGDGYDDFIIGAADANSTGRAYVFYGSLSMTSVINAASANVILSGTAASDKFGQAVASAGDSNGDGFSDIIVGAYQAPYSGSAGPGRAYVFYGSASMTHTAAVSANIILTGVESSGSYGYSVASAGDMNGDGFSDLIVGANGVSSNKGRAYIYYMSQQINSTQDRRIEYPDTDAESSVSFGKSVASGDFNADGYMDALIGAPDADGGGTDRGRAYVFNGSASGLATALPLRLEYPDPDTDTSVYFGNSVASGDFNADGYPDALIGAYGADGGGSGRGRAYVFNGSASGLVTATPLRIEYPDPDIWTSSFFGNAVTSADFNADGYPDALIGAYGDDAGCHSSPCLRGRAYVFKGSSSGLDIYSPSRIELPDPDSDISIYFGRSVASGDFNADGYPDALIGASSANAGGTDRGRVYVFNGSSSGIITVSPLRIEYPNMDTDTSVYFGYSVVSGDYNADGYSDALIGAYGADAGGTGRGRAYVFNGSASGIVTASPLRIEYPNPDTDTTVYFGYSVVSGDYNADGYSDALIGAYGADAGGTDRGRAYVFNGSDFGLITTSPLRIEYPDSDTDTTVNFGQSVASGDFNADGYLDALIGAPYANGGGTNRGRAYVFNGGGTTTVPVFNFTSKATTSCVSGLTATWNGQSSINTSYSNIKMEAYKFGSTNAWVTVTSTSTLASSTDGTLTYTISSGASDYLDANNQTYWRVYQNRATFNASQYLKTDYWNMQIAGLDPVTISNHTVGQVSNQWSGSDISTTSIHYRYKLTPSGSLTLGTTTFNLSGISGINAGDITNAAFYIDTNNNGSYDAVGGSESTGTPYKIDDASNFGYDSSSRQIMRASNGDLYTVLFDDPSNTIEVWKSTDEGQNWSEQDSSDHKSGTAPFSAAIDGNDTIHIVYTQDTSMILYTTFSSGGFAASYEIIDDYLYVGTYSPIYGRVDDASISIDSNNIPHVFSSGNGVDDWVAESYNLGIYRNRIGGSWDGVDVYFLKQDMSQDDPLYGEIIINKDNIPEIAIQTNYENNLYLFYGNQNDASSFPSVSIDNTIGSIGNQSIAIDSNGNTWVAYQDSNSFVTLAKHSYGTSWSGWTYYTNNNIGVFANSLAINGTNVYIFYQDDNNDIVYDRYNGSSWLGETILAAGSYYNTITKWSYYFNNGGSTQIDYLYSDGTDIYYNYLTTPTGDTNVSFGNVVITGNSGTITFATSSTYALDAATDYILELTVSNLSSGGSLAPIRMSPGGTMKLKGSISFPSGLSSGGGSGGSPDTITIDYDSFYSGTCPLTVNGTVDTATHTK